MKHKKEINGRLLAWEQTGTGARPVVLMHGWGCNSSTVASLARAATLPGTTVYNLDLPGFGDSPEPPADWGIGDYTALIEEFCRTLGLERPVLMGHSFGGRIAIQMASRTPVAKVVLVDAAGIKPRRSLKYYIKVYSYKAAKKILTTVFGAKGRTMVDIWTRRAGSSDYAQASPVMRSVMSRVVNEDLTACLPSIKAPTLLIWGEKDTATPMADARKMESLIPDAGLVSYPEAGHYSFLDRPTQTAAVIASFLKD